MSRVFKRDGRWWVDYNDASGVRRREKVAATERVAKEVLNKTLDKVAREILGTGGREGGRNLVRQIR